MQAMSVPATAPTEDERTWGMYAHLTGMLAYTAIPFGGVLGPLFIYTQSKHTRPFAAAQARASLNFHITISILQCVCVVLAIGGYIPMLASAMSDTTQPPNFTGIMIFATGLVGFFLLYAWSFVMTIVNTIQAAQGRYVTYPFTIRFFNG